MGFFEKKSHSKIWSTLKNSHLLTTKITPLENEEVKFENQEEKFYQTSLLVTLLFYFIFKVNMI
jgi:hypothetical protein